jgi:hypothetical protein
MLLTLHKYLYEKEIAPTILLSSCFVLTAITVKAEQFNVLVFTKIQDYHHQFIIEGVCAIRELGKVLLSVLTYRLDSYNMLHIY